MKTAITRLVDSCYFPFLRFIPLQTFRYAVVGGANVVYGILQYWFIYNFVLDQQDVNLAIVVISAPIFAFLINFLITFFTGFYLTRNIAFDKSQIRGHIQFCRYGLVVALNVAINYGGLKLLVEGCNVYPSIANALVQSVTVSLSFFMNKFFTFKA